MKLVISIFFSLLSLNAFSHSNESSYSVDEIYKVGRYSSVSIEPSHAQVDLLSVIIELEFPRSVTTVGSALEIMLINSGYGLSDLSAADPNLIILLNSPLPNVHRKLGPISLRTALNVLSGSTWDLVIDPLHRLISFELNEGYSY